MITSFFLSGMIGRDDDEWDILYKKTNYAWLDIKLKNYFIKFRDIFSQKNKIFGFSMRERIDITDIYLNEKIVDFPSEELLLLFLKTWLNINNNEGILIKNRTEENYKTNELENSGSIYFPKPKFCYSITKNPINKISFTEKAFATKISKNISYNANYRMIYNAFNIKSRLKLKKPFKIRAALLFELPFNDQDFILLPFLYKNTSSKEHEIECTPGQLDLLCKWVKPYLEEDLSIDQIRGEYQQMIKYIDETIVKYPELQDSWLKARKLT